MPVPKRKRSRQRRDKRFANKGLSFPQVGLCSNCESPLLGHQACKECGFYKGRKVLATKTERSDKRAIVNDVRQLRAAALEAQAQQADTPATGTEA